MAQAIVARYRSEAPEGCDPQNTYVAIVGTVVSVGVGAYQAYQSKKAAAKVGEKPEAAQYGPVNFGKMQLKTVKDDAKNLGWINGLTDATNTSIASQDVKRATRFIPRYKSIMQQEGLNASALTRGELPYDDVLDIASSRSGLANSLGTPGAAGPATLKDLGLSRLSAMESGTNLFKNMVGIAEAVSPVARYSRPQDYLLTPGQTIPWALEEAQLKQQSQQNANNLKAGASPSQLASSAAQASGATNPYASIGPAIGTIGGLLSNYNGGGGGGGLTSSGGYGSLSGAATAAPYTNSFSYDPSMGYTPVAQQYSAPAT